MKAMAGKAKAVLAEIPTFCGLCKTIMRLVFKTSKKQDAAEKSTSPELRARVRRTAA